MELNINIGFGGPADGYTPYVGDNGNWWYSSIDTGIKADYSSEETLRAQEESVRVAAEALRVSDEQARVSNENSRKTTENLRKNAENARELAELKRDEDESIRRLLEEERGYNEEGRITDEVNRGKAEVVRANNESIRIQNENARKDEESKRSTNEQARINAETLRNNQENARKLSETNRVAEENKRIEAERLRAEKDAGRDAKIKNVEDKSAQLEQELNVLRGDVQGIQDNQQTNINSFGVSTTPSEIGGDYFVEMWFNTGNLNWTEEAKSNYIFAFGNSDGRQRYGLCYIYNKTSLTFAYSGQGGSNSPTTYEVNPNTLYHFVVSRNGNLSEMWVNGVKLASKEFNGIAGSYYNIINKVNIEGKGTISTYKIRRFNIATTQQLVDMLYNQGRCDEVVLGDEWRSGNNFNFSNTITYAGDNVSAVNTTLSGIKKGCLNKIIIDKPDTIGNLVLLLMKGTSSSLGYDYLYAPKEAGVYTFDYISVSEDQILGFRCDNSSVSFDIKVSISTVNLLNEYLPSYLTKTKWIDNGVSKQEIPYADPTFTYIHPYRQYSFGSGAPSTPPDAAFTEYGDVDSDGIWKAKPKPSTRRFAVSDWKQINN